MTAAIRLRASSPDDRPALSAMILRAVENLSGEYWTPERRERLAAEFSTDGPGTGPQKGYRVVALVDGRIAATGTLAGPWLVNVFVDPGQQGAGLGVRIVRHLEARAARQGLARLSLYAFPGTEGFYVRLGYELDPDDQRSPEGYRLMWRLTDPEDDEEL